VMESFYTIQGEGFYQGRAAYFIRLGGCDVGCVWCDVKESWEENRHPRISIDQIVSEAVKALRMESHLAGTGMPAEVSPIVVVTGGEPMMHDCTALTRALHNSGFKINLETSGAYPLTGTWDWICFSPKKFKEPLSSVAIKADELKVIIFNKSDFKWAEKHASIVGKNCKLFLQPEWSRSVTVTPMIVEYIKKNPRWEFSLQLHKYIHVP
jgi:7-carboxy-7-deazaguanine synthase